MDDAPPPDTRGGRIIEAVAVAVLTAIGTHLVEALAEALADRLKKWRAKRKRKPRRTPEAMPEEEGEDPVLYAGAPYHVYPVGEGHDTEGCDCWCKPVVEVQAGGGRLIIHREQVS